MKKADHVIFANEERMVVLKEKHNLKNKCTYFLNLPYFEDKDEYEIDNKNKSKLIELDELITSGFKFIIHQGVLEYERGREKLAEFSRILPDNFKILLLGGSLQDYNTFIVEYKLDSSKFHFVGSVNYLVLPKFWERGIASIVMYLPTYINNRLCAPNRFYISVQKGLPVIVNKNNPVLSNFIVKYDSGFFIEDITADNFYNIESKKIEENLFSDLKKQQINEFLNVYDTLLQ